MHKSEESFNLSWQKTREALQRAITEAPKSGEQRALEALADGLDVLAQQVRGLTTHVDSPERVRS